MKYLFMDASAWIKFYVPEPGADIIAHLMSIPLVPRRIILTSTVIAETVAVLNRKRNQLRISNAVYDQAIGHVLTYADWCIHWRTYDNDIIEAMPLATDHNINASDGLHLYKVLQLRDLLRRSGNSTVILVASDYHFLRAAAAEGLTTLDPEAASVEDVAALLQ